MDVGGRRHKAEEIIDAALRMLIIAVFCTTREMARVYIRATAAAVSEKQYRINLVKQTAIIIHRKTPPTKLGSTNAVVWYVSYL